MASIKGAGENVLDSVLPTYGNPRWNVPIWNESQRMFITEQYTSAAGNTYYLGIRFSDRFVTILHVGLYRNWTYINEVEAYAFNGQERILIGKTNLDQYYNEDLIRSTTEKLLSDYLEGQHKLQGSVVDRPQLERQVKGLVEDSYKSLLDNGDTLRRLEAVMPLLEAEKKKTMGLLK